MDISNQSIYNLEWDLLTLEELGEFERGKSKHRPRHDSILFGGSYPFIQTGEIKAANSRITKFENTYNEKGLSQSKLWNKNTLCITIAANIAETAILDIEACFPDSVVGFIPKLDSMDSYFMHYIFTYMRKKIQNSVSGSVQDNINIAYLKKLKFRIPIVEKRKKIVSILKSLDDKIEINNEMNKTLEEMAQTLFKRWFIDFDFPNENGEPYRSSGGKMVDSELGEIPEGWEVKELESFVEKLSKGTTPTKKDVENATSIEKIPFIKVKDLKDDGEIIMNNLEYISRDISENKLKRSIIKTNDVLFTIAGTIGKVSIVPTTLSNGNLNQAIAFIRLKNLKYREYIYYYLKSKETQNVISSKIVQAVQANVSLSILNNLRVLNPTYEILDSYNLLVKKTFDLYLKNQQEKQLLTEIRDTLLPKLMSGEIEV